MSDTQEPDGPRTPVARNPLVIETALAVGLALALLMLGTIVFLLVTGPTVTVSQLPLYLATVLGWRSLIWIVASVGIAVLLRNGDRALRLKWGILAAAVAAILEISIRFGASIPFMGQALAFAALPWLLGIGSFVLCAALGWTLALRLLDAPPGGRLSPVVPIVTTVLLVLGGVGIPALVAQWFGAHPLNWSSGYQPPELDDFGPEGVRYLATVGLSGVALVAAIVLAWIHRAWGSMRLGFALLAVFLVFAFVFQVPSGRFVQERETPELPSDYTPCFGGLDDPGCEGG